MFIAKIRNTQRLLHPDSEISKLVLQLSNPIDTCIYVCIYLSFIQVEQKQT